MLPILFKLGPLTLHTYGLMVALGFLTGFTVAKKQFEYYGLPLSALDQLLLWIMVTGIFGARILYFVAEDFSSLVADPLSFFRVWEGGLVFYGGFLGALLAISIFSQLKKIPLLVLLDALMPSLFLAQALGRLGCFAAGCCYGKASTLPWAVVYNNVNSLAPLGSFVHPTQIYESLGAFSLFLLWLVVQPLNRKYGPGLGSIYYLLTYGTLRFFIEFLRGDFRGPTPYNLYPSQWISLGCIFLGVGILISFLRQRHAR